MVIEKVSLIKNRFASFLDKAGILDWGKIILPNQKISALWNWDL